jgi:aminoglycoside 2'-N-acetyltransferase I
MKPMDKILKLEVLHADQLTSEQRAEIHALCKRAYAMYDVDLDPLFQTFTDTTHVIGWWGSDIVSHAMWVTRWLQPSNQPPLRTAYVEMVATEPQFQGRGFATAVMRRLASSIHDFEIGGLSPAEPMLYTRLGWVFWQGPLFIRTQAGLLSTPDGSVMILRLPKTPPLDLTLPLSAEWREGELW